MKMNNNHPYACLALSGGMDSSTLLIHLLARGYQVTALSFLYGQKHSVEIEYAQKLIHYLAEKNHSVNHQIIDLTSLESLLFSTLINDNAPVPEGHYQQENMRLTVVPNRNKIFLSILQSVALSIALRTKYAVIIALGIHAGDAHTYPDTLPQFIDLDYQAFLSGNWDADDVTNYMPYQYFSKYQVLLDGKHACEHLNLPFEAIYSRTITSYKPNSLGISDYKSSASIARIEAFIRLNEPDPILYADETGIVDWEIVKAHVQSILTKP